jgi:hypothetical protein
MNLKNIANKKERILSALWLGGEVNVKDLKYIVEGSYLPNLLNRLEKEKLIRRKKYRNVKVAYLTDEGIDYVCLHYYLYNKDSPVENLYERSIKNEEVMRKEKRAKAYIAFSFAGVKILQTIPDISTKTQEQMYIDSYKLKKKLGDEVRGSRITGIYFTPDEVYRVFSTEGNFIISPPVEKRVITRLRTKIMENNETKKKIKDIVLCSNIEQISMLINEKNVTISGGSMYKIYTNERNQYYVPLCDAAEQIQLISNIKNRDVEINNILSRNVGNEISNRKLIEYENGYIVNILDLNLGIIQTVFEMSRKGKNITVICRQKYITFFNNLFQQKVEFITISDEDFKLLINQVN